MDLRITGLLWILSIMEQTNKSMKTPIEQVLMVILLTCNW